jgi:hypothetical protein
MIRGPFHGNRGQCWVSIETLVVFKFLTHGRRVMAPCGKQNNPVSENDVLVLYKIVVGRIYPKPVYNHTEINHTEINHTEINHTEIDNAEEQ